MVFEQIKDNQIVNIFEKVYVENHAHTRLKVQFFYLKGSLFMPDILSFQVLIDVQISNNFRQFWKSH